MSLKQPRYTADETVQRAEDFYQRTLRLQIEAAHQGEYVAIDVDSGEYEIGANYHKAAQRLLLRHPEAAIGVLRIGYPAVGRIGGRVKAAQ